MVCCWLRDSFFLGGRFSQRFIGHHLRTSTMRGWFDLFFIGKLFMYRKDTTGDTYDLSFKSCIRLLGTIPKSRVDVGMSPPGGKPTPWIIHPVGARGRTLFLEWRSFEACESTLLHRHQCQGWFGSCWSLVEMRMVAPLLYGEYVNVHLVFDLRWQLMIENKAGDNLKMFSVPFLRS